MLDPRDPFGAEDDGSLHETRSSDVSPADTGSGEAQTDLFSELFRSDGSASPHGPVRSTDGSTNLRTDKPRSGASGPDEPPRLKNRPVSSARKPHLGTEHREIPPPRVPRSLADAGLGEAQICEMILKQIAVESNILGQSIAARLRLPFFLIEDSLRFLKTERCIEVTSGADYGAASYRFSLTDVGRDRAKQAFDQCRYVGPAPVSLADYAQQCRRQNVAGVRCGPEALNRAFSNLIIRPFLLEELGPAVCGGNSMFLFGPPGNGKTQIAKGLGRFLNESGGEIYVPYAIQTDGGLITVFDPTLHETTDDHLLEAAASGEKSQMETEGIDARWRKIRRPVVITGGELTLEMLDLRYNSVSNFYTAPIHLKANGGVFLIDDFGRQIVSPKNLLNRWIFPLEESIDYLSLATGKKFPVPFEQLIIFSTNLEPRDLVDEAFLRRIRHKIEIGPPSRDLYTEIFQLCCRMRKIPYRQEAVDFLYQNFYDVGKQPRASDPRDLLEIATSICRFRNETVRLSPELLAEATRRFFCNLGGEPVQSA